VKAHKKLPGRAGNEGHGGTAPPARTRLGGFTLEVIEVQGVRVGRGATVGKKDSIRKGATAVDGFRGAFGKGKGEECFWGVPAMKKL